MKSKALLFAFIFFCLKVQAVELKTLEFKKSAIILKFKDRGTFRRLEDPTGWIALRVLTVLTYQNAIEKSYKNPEETFALLKSEAPLLRKLSPCFTKALLLLKRQNLTDAQKELVESSLDSDLFDYRKNRRRSTDDVLNSKLQPLLSLEPMRKITEIKDGKRVEIPRHSLNPQDGIAFELSASQLQIPSTMRYRTKARIDADPSTIHCDR